MSRGLLGVIAGETSISSVNVPGRGLSFRGYRIVDLIENCSYDEVAFLLLYHHLPSPSEYTSYLRRLNASRSLPSAVTRVLEELPAQTHPMDILRTAVSVLAGVEPEPEPPTTSSTMRAGERILACLPSVLFYWHYWMTRRRRVVLRPQSDSETTAHFFLRLLHSRPPTPLQLRAMEVSLVLYAEHDLAASSFAARVVASTRSDVHSCVCAAISALKGPLHGGANEASMKLFEQFSSADDAERGVKRMLQEKKIVVGFGHRVYKMGDPRSPLIEDYAWRLARAPGGNLKLLEMAARIDQVMLAERGMRANLDYYSALVYHQLGMPTLFFTPCFVISRTAGWVAHVAEQRANNRLIRPFSMYIGSDEKMFLPLTLRRESASALPTPSSTPNATSSPSSKDGASSRDKDKDSSKNSSKL